MELKNILLSQAIRFIAETEPPIERRSPVPLINGIREKYGFIQVPLTVDDLDFKKGVTFLQGYYKGKIINKLQIYENGLLCEANEDNSLIDEFLGELFAWAKHVHKLPMRETGVRAYLSQMEVISAIDIGAVFSKVAPIGGLLAEALKAYGQPVQEYKISGLKMHYDSMALPVPRAPEFAFERRAGELYSANEFFTSAPVRTGDHLQILEALEKVFKEAEQHYKETHAAKKK